MPIKITGAIVESWKSKKGSDMSRVLVPGENRSLIIFGLSGTPGQKVEVEVELPRLLFISEKRR